MKYLLWISYDGKNYYGWSPQPNVPTIYGEIHKSVKKIFKNNFKIRASGRTDRYVHSLSLPVTLSLNNIDEMKKKEDVLNLMNKNLPSDIIVKKIEIVKDNFEVRFNAKKKSYKYLTNLSGEGDENYFNNHTYPFDLDKLISTSKLFIGKKNYASFTGKSTYENTIREVFNISIKEEKNILTITIEGNGFLRFMVRNIVGTLLAHNRGAISTEEIIDFFENPKIGKSHYKARAGGLYLVNVIY